MTTQELGMDETARQWMIRVQDSAFDDWDGLTLWLEQDAAHLAAYDAALDVDAWAVGQFRSEPATEPARVVEWAPAPRPRRRWLAMGGAIAAAVVGVLTFSMVDLNGPGEIVTGPGEHRAIPLADGSRIILNGESRIKYDPDQPREVELAAGEALFEIRHDEKNPFVVVAGGARLLDAGTVFNVISEEGSLDVAVAEGAVIYQPGRQQIKLAAGDALSRQSAQSQPVLRKASRQAVGGWQSGQLEYSDASLGQVARDLGRNLGRTIRPAAGAERLRFSGTLVVKGPAAEVLDRAGPLLGVDFAADGDDWRMTPANGAPPY